MLRKDGTIVGGFAVSLWGPFRPSCFRSRLSMAVLFLGLSACSSLSPSNEVKFSPDGSMMAYGFAKLWDLPLPPEGYTFCSHGSVRWCSVDQPKEWKGVNLGYFGPEYAFRLSSLIHPAFCPDSRLLAIASPGQLSLVDLGSKSRRSLTRPGEDVTSFAWLSENEIGYVTHTNKLGSRDRLTDRRFWRQDVRQGPERRVEVYRQDGFDGFSDLALSSMWWPLERWSSRGRYVIFVDRSRGGQFHLLEVHTGKVTAFGRAGVSSVAVSWKPDESSAVCVSRLGQKSYQAVLVDSATVELTDFSDKFNEVYAREQILVGPIIPPFWTPDGRYFVANDLHHGGCLISPHPWELIPVARRFLEHLSKTDKRRLFREHGDSQPWIMLQPAIGWVKVWVQFAVLGVPLGVDFAVDYKAERFVQLGASHSQGGGWTLTPDGKRAVIFDRAKNLAIHPVNLPEDKTR